MSLFTTQAAEDHPIRCQRLICGLNIIAKLARGHHVTLFFSIVKTLSRREFKKEDGLPFERYDVTSEQGALAWSELCSILENIETSKVLSDGMVRSDVIEDGKVAIRKHL